MIINPWLTIFLIILVGFIAATLGSFMGSGGGLITVVLVVLILGSHYNQEAKLIMFPALLASSIFGIIKYIRLKQPPDWRATILIGIGTIPISIIGILYISPFLNTPEFRNYFPFIYAGLILALILLIDFKEKLKLKKTLPFWSLPLGGAIIGFLAGTFGLGMLTMPLLVVGLKIPLKKAVVTFLALIVMYATTDIMVAVIDGQYSSFSSDGILWYLPIVILVGSITGSQIGPLMNKKVSARGMKIIFNIIMLAILFYELIEGIIILT